MYAATGGTVLLEFILLSQLSGEKKFARAAEKATKALWQRRSEIGLLGSHVRYIYIYIYICIYIYTYIYIFMGIYIYI